MQRIRSLALFVLLTILLLTARAPLSRASPDTPNDATQARLRVSACALGGPSIDIYVNGQVAVNGGVRQARLGALDWSGYLYLAPGSYSVSLVPSGQSLDHAYLGPVNVSVVAGHRYSLAAIGQASDASHQPLLVDETAAYQTAGLTPKGAGHISINNVKGATSFHFTMGGSDPEGGVPYGGFKAGVFPLGPLNGLVLRAGDATDQEIASDPSVFFNTPGINWLDCFSGTYPGNVDNHTAASTSELDSVALLQALTTFSPQTKSQSGAVGQVASYSIFVDALKRTGLDKMLITGGPYLLFPPTDDAFTALPKDKLAALLADPKALSDLVRSHVVAGYYPAGSLGTNGPSGGFNRTVTNLLGAPLVLGPDQLSINGHAVTGGDSAFVANGTRIIGINFLILPAIQTSTVVASTPSAQPTPPVSTPTKQASTAPGMPGTGADGQKGVLDLFLIMFAALVVLLAGGFLWRWAAARR